MSVSCTSGKRPHTVQVVCPLLQPQCLLMLQTASFSFSVAASGASLPSLSCSIQIFTWAIRSLFYFSFTFIRSSTVSYCSQFQVIFEYFDGIHQPWVEIWPSHSSHHIRRGRVRNTDSFLKIDEYSPVSGVLQACEKHNRLNVSSFPGTQRADTVCLANSRQAEKTLCLAFLGSS